MAKIFSFNSANETVTSKWRREQITAIDEANGAWHVDHVLKFKQTEQCRVHCTMKDQVDKIHKKQRGNKPNKAE